jgi:cytoskeleton protein RodZ
MAPNQHPESTRSVYDTCDANYLRQLRESVGMDLGALASIACLSPAQVRQLESDGSDSLFYSSAIKRQSYKRLLLILGAEPPPVEVSEALPAASNTDRAEHHALDQIVAMSHQPSIRRSISDVLHCGFSRLSVWIMAHKQMLGALLLLLVAVTLFVLYGQQHVSALSESMVVSEPAASTPEPVASEEANPVAVPASEASDPVLPVASAPVVAPALAVPASVTSQAQACAYASEAMPSLTSFAPHKEGRYVYLVSSVNAAVCVVDGDKQATFVEMKAGENRSVYGVSPWQVSGADLQKVQIYFQGGRVPLPDTVTNRVKLVEVPVLR